MQATLSPAASHLAEQRWKAVVERDRRADGQFVYAVKTTGIFCRPGRPSKLAKRQNIEFFDTADLAISAGGMPPSRYRKGAEGEHIRFAVEPCSLGLIIVAATGKGICTIEFGDETQTLIDRLHSHFPKAQFSPADAVFQRWSGEILAYLDQPQGTLKLPLDIQGTIFQRRVWQALQNIPAGQTVSYTELATRIGQPKAFRAVAHACASNHIAAAIPCHRVVGKNGDLSGYRWGIARKAELLRREKKS